MQELLFGSWGPQVFGLGRDVASYGVQYPWRAFAILLVIVLLLDMLFWKRSVTGDWPEPGGLGGDGDGGGE